MLNFKKQTRLPDPLKTQIILPESYSRRTVEVMFGRIWVSGCLGGLAIAFSTMGGLFFSTLALVSITLSILVTCVFGFMYIDWRDYEDLCKEH